METNETTGNCLDGTEYQTTDSINLTGCWFVNFGAELTNAKIEGSRILTLNGNFDPDKIIDVLVEAIYSDLPEQAKELLDNAGQKPVIRSFNRI